MPAPTQTALKTHLKMSLLAQGFIKRQYVDGKLIETPSELPTDMDKMVDGMCRGLNLGWTEWQAAQTVVGSAPPPTFAVVGGKLP